MRSLIEIGEHSIWAPGLASGGCVIDAGANHGRFSEECGKLFSVDVLAIEANPKLAGLLRDSAIRMVECALGAANGKAVFHVGENDETSSIREPSGDGVHLRVEEDVTVEVRTLSTIIGQEKVTNISLVKLDIEGAEIEVLNELASSANKISPQWTIEFHDDAEFGLCSKQEVDGVIRLMQDHGFSVLVRNWPSRTNVLFVDRRRLGINIVVWFCVKARYQYLAVIWRKVRGI